MDREPLSPEEVRERARLKLKGICGVYRICDGLDTRLCQGHGYGSPIGLGGAGTGASFANNIRALDRLRLKTRLVGEDFKPDTRFDFLGTKLAMPIMGASVAGVNSFGGEAVISEKEFCRAVVLGCREAGTIGWRGDSFNYSLETPWGIDAAAEAGGWAVQIVKPRSQEAVRAFFRKAENAGCRAVGVDIDGHGSYAMNLHGQPVYRKSKEELRELVAATALPVIFKGIMCAQDAEAAAESGAKAVVVSNHGGRVMDHTPGTAEALPEIVRAVGTDLMVIADGGVRSGADVVKMLALGARAVLVGRDLVRAAVGAGVEGVAVHMRFLAADLARTMKMAGCSRLEEISGEVLDKT